ncbi:MAG: polysaccharide deacetylase family protein [Thermomicrobiales bacterium]
MIQHRDREPQVDDRIASAPHVDFSQDRGSTAQPVLKRLLPRIIPTSIRRRSGPVILMYHQVAEIENDHWSMAVRPAYFDEHLQILKDRCRPISLPQLTTEMTSGQLDPRSVVVTFDDGYLDNLIRARPLLERYGIPATMFIVGDAIGQQREFWWDYLQNLLLGEHPLPDALQLRISGRRHSWRLGAKRTGLNVPKRWTRPQLYRLLWHELRMLPRDERMEVIESLRDWADHPVVVRPSRQVMNETELLRLAGSDGIEIGAHTATHPRMSALSPAQQFEEVERGKLRLEEILGRRVSSFSYPFGGTFDVSGASVEAVRRAGFARACTTRNAMVRPRTNPLRLPRLYVGNWSGEEFERRMHSWLPT